MRAGALRVPGDKSISHRALMLAALASGESRIRGLPGSEDVASTARVLRALGVPLPPDAADMAIPGVGFDGLRPPISSLQCGNSGTTARLMCGVLAACPFTVRLEGDASLSRRPMRRVAEPLSAMGAEIEFATGDGLPLTVRGGRLVGIAWRCEVASAQVKSAILLAGLVGGVSVTIAEPWASRDHTERVLRWLGVQIRSDGGSTALHPVRSIEAFDLDIPGDPSSAAYLVAAAVLGFPASVEIADVCVNPGRTGFFRQLRRMGAKVEYVDVRERCGEDVGVIRARRSRLRSTRVFADEVPSSIDELPLLACVAAGAGVNLEVHGAEELRKKETDRIAATVVNLRNLGCDARELRDGFVVSAQRVRLRGRVRTDGDHRIAMAFGVLAAMPGHDISIDDPDCVAVSYPQFWGDLARVSGARQYT